MNDSSQPAAPEDVAFREFRRTGDADALAAVYDALAPGLLRLAMKLLGDAASAEDALQATFVTAIESARQHDGARPVRPWLAGVLANHIRGLRRRSSRRPDPQRLAPPHEVPEPDHEIRETELLASIDRHVRDLPDAWQEPILLRVRDGLTAREIAAMLGRPHGTIRSQIARGLTRLRRGMAWALGLVAALFVSPRGRASGASSLLAVPLGGLAMLVAMTLAISWFLTDPTSEPITITMEDPIATVRAQPMTTPLRVAPATTAQRLTFEGAVAVPAALPVEDISLDIDLLVIDEHDVSIPHATVDVYAARADYVAREAPTRTLQFDESGRGLVTLAGNEVLVARGDGMRSVSVAIEEARMVAARAQDGVAIVVLRPLVTVRGVVVGDGEIRVPHAEVSVTYSGGPVGPGAPWRPRTIQADARGEFAVELDGPAVWSFGARRDGGVFSSPLRLDTKPGDVDEIKLRVPGNWLVAGRVTNASGAPVADADVRIFPLGQPPSHEWPRRHHERFMAEVTTDAGGRFEATPQALGRYEILANAAGAAPSDALHVELTLESPQVDDLEIVLPDAATITGRVIDANGDPLVAVTVSTSSPGGEVVYPHAPTPHFGQRNGLAHTTTNAEGAFTLDGLRADAVFSVIASPRHLATGAALSVREVAAGTSGLILVDDTAERTITVRGRFVEANTGAPIPHFKVKFHQRRGDVQFSTDESVSDDEGRFEFELRTKTEFALEFIALGDAEEIPQFRGTHRSRRSDVGPVTWTWRSYADSLEGIVVEAPRTSRIAVLVSEADGTPSLRSRVAVTPERPLLSQRSWFPRWTDAAGHAMFEDLAPATWRVTVLSEEGFTPQMIELIPGETTNVTFVRTHETR